VRRVGLLLTAGALVLALAGSGSGASERTLSYFPQDAVWSANGKWVAVPISSGGLYGEVLVVNLRTRKSRRIPLAVARHHPQPISWSPRHPAFVVTSDRGVFLATVGRGARKIANGRFGGWSPDGKRMVLTIGAKGGPKSVAIADRKGVILRTIRDGAEAGPWSPSGKEIAVIARGSLGKDRVHVIRPDGSQYRQLTSETRVHEGKEQTRSPQSSPVWSPDGKLLAFTEGTENAIPVFPWYESYETLVFRSGSTTEPVRLGPGHPLWSPASKKVALASCCLPSALTVMSPDGRGPRRRFEVGRHFATEWSPDGRWFLLQSWDRPETLIRLRRDGRMDYLRDGKFPDISPRGDWIVFTRSRPHCDAVFAMKLATRRVVRLTDC
jgi:Tol biopolymer transport system component